ncbi:MAG: hypothetical protein OD918_09540 [Gammaproteobacteria bacterium]
MDKNELRDKQLAQLKEAAKIFLRPQDKLPFSVVVEAMTGKEVLPMTESARDRGMLHVLAESCVRTVASSVRRPFAANRPNDVSAQVEKRLHSELEGENISVETPRSATGRGGGSGYPDRLLMYQDAPSYLEVKVSREQNIDQASARNFFFKPSIHSKIGHSARHLLAGFSLREVSEKLWILTGWKIVDLFDLRVSLKPEYNAANPEIYRDDLVLLQGDGGGIF